MSLNINITNLKVNNISSLGSLNIGKTWLCHNQTTDITAAEGTSTESTVESTEEMSPKPTETA